MILVTILGKPRVSLTNELPYSQQALDGRASGVKFPTYAGTIGNQPLQRPTTAGPDQPTKTRLRADEGARADELSDTSTDFRRGSAHFAPAAAGAQRPGPSSLARPGGSICPREEHSGTMIIMISSPTTSWPSPGPARLARGALARVWHEESSAAIWP